MSGQTDAYLFGWHWQNAAGSLWAALVCIGGSAGALSLARRAVPAQGRVIAFLSENAFAVYVIHPPILVALALAMRALPLGPIGTFLLLWLLATVLTFGLAAPLVRRVPGLASILR